MRKFIFVTLGLLTMCATTLRADNERAIAVNQLPAAAQEFVKQHFADRKIALAKVETEIFSKSYEVFFADGDHIDFDGNGNWTEVDCKMSAVPNAIVPEPIRQYVGTTYPDATIKKIDKEPREYEVKLSNRLELTFDTAFNLKDIDN